MTRVGSGSSLRARSLITSSVASSAQWTSSSTRTFGVCCRRSCISAVTTSCGGASRATASTSAPPRPSATARRGPSGLGVNSGSQPPENTSTDCGCSSQNLRMSVVLPTPASPTTTTSLPRPTEASATAPASTSSALSRSSRSSCSTGPASTCGSAWAGSRTPEGTSLRSDHRGRNARSTQGRTDLEAPCPTGWPAGWGVPPGEFDWRPPTTLPGARRSTSDLRQSEVAGKPAGKTACEDTGRSCSGARRHPDRVGWRGACYPVSGIIMMSLSPRSTPAGERGRVVGDERLVSEPGTDAVHEGERATYASISFIVHLSDLLWRHHPTRSHHDDDCRAGYPASRACARQSVTAGGWGVVRAR